MAERHSGILIFSMATFACLGCFGVLVLFLRPSITLGPRPELIGPEDEEVWALLRSEASLEQIQHAVRATGKHVDQIAWVGGTLLSYAAAEGRPELVEWLLQQGANPDRSAPLFRAICGENVGVIRMLLDHGADPDLDMGGGLTPRVAAVHRGNPAVIRELERTEVRASGERSAHSASTTKPLEAGTPHAASWREGQ